MEIPPRFDKDVKQLTDLEQRAQQEPELQYQAIALIEGILRRLAEGESQSFRGALLSSLGDAHAQLPTGDGAANLEQAIACYTEALRLLTSEDEPFGYARTQSNLGAAHADLPTGDRAANLGQAIACLTEALRFLTPEDTPLDYARTQSNLGAAYAELPSGNRAANLAGAIDCLTEALRFLTLEDTPLDYARTQNNLGAAYSELQTGDRAANLERAIACYIEALRFLTPEAAPLNYARTQSNLGAAYAELPTGNRAANLGQAIACLTEALRFLTPEDTRLDYARTQTNLGAAYAELQTGNRAANLERAIACHTEALRSRTPEDTPLDYARTQTNLGAAYAELQTGNRAANLGRAIACLTEALRCLTPEAAPFDYAVIQMNLGLAYAELPSGDRAANRAQTIACLTEALRYLTPEAAPVGHRRAAGKLALLHFNESHWADSHAFYTLAIHAAELLYEATATEVGRQVELLYERDLVPNGAYCLARLGRFREAVERLEGGRARALAETLARDRAALGAASELDREAFEAARDRVKQLEAEARATGEGFSEERSARSIVELAEALAAARGELSEVVKRIRGYVPEFMAEGLAYADIAAPCTASRPLVYLLTTTKGSLALIVTADTQDQREEHAAWLDEFSAADMDALLLEEDERGQVTGGLLVGQVMGDVKRLEAALDRALPVLRARLIGPLAKRLRTLGFSEATLVPVGRLSLLPLPAAAPEGLTVALTPSARALRAAGAAAEHALSLPPVLLAVGNPLPLPRSMQSLAFAAAEAEALGSMFGPGSHVLVATKATREGLLSNLEGTTHLHLACHGSFDVDEPLDSGFVLSGGERLTLRDLLDGDLDLSPARLAVLSACQSGISEYRRVPDEAIGLPAGFLQAGVPGVVSTLWPVNDVSTALLVAEFYRLMLAELLDPAAAMRGAQEFVRISTAQQLDLADWFERRYQASGGTDRDAFEAAVYYRANPEGRPFEHPRYWAGFVFTGV
jgi:CHAT domain-containing protein/tetratricopeptide (TPR) repeat protein